MAKPGTLDDREKVMKLHEKMALQHRSMSKFYEGIGERMQMRSKVVVRSRIMSMVLVLAVIGLLIIAPVRGFQGEDESTPRVVEEPVEEVTPPVVVVDPPVVVDIEPGEPPVVIVDSGFNLTAFLGGIVTGVFVTLGGVFGVIGRYKDNLPALNAIEWLGKSAPPEMVKAMNDMATKMADAAYVLIKVTDNLPNEAGAPAVYSKRVMPTGEVTKPLPEDGDLG